jgi:hypothetical protein
MRGGVNGLKAESSPFLKCICQKAKFPKLSFRSWLPSLRADFHLGAAVA